MRNRDMFWQQMPSEEMALPGRASEMQITDNHYILGYSQIAPNGNNLVYAMFGMGCFWGAERLFWQLGGVYTTAVGYIAGHTKNPTYEEVCSGRTGHTEAVRVVFDPKEVGIEVLLKTFWEGHDPTQGMRQGNDVGTQYRSGIYISSESQRQPVEKSFEEFYITKVHIRPSEHVNK